MLSWGDARLGCLSWALPQDVLVEAPVVVVALHGGCVFVFCVLFLCLCVLSFSCPPCSPVPPPLRSILTLVCLAHPSSSMPAVPHLLPCPAQPPSSSSSPLLPRKQPFSCALKTAGLGKGSEVKFWSVTNI